MFHAWNMSYNLPSHHLWDVVVDSYERGSYTTSIINLVQYVNEVVRERSELSYDNTKLMNNAFLGSNPHLKINNLETQTEKDTQEGVGYLLKGVCLAIRNPRSHERIIDNIDTADRIILFIDFVLKFITASQSTNLIEDWLEIVFDKEFVDTQEYAEALFQDLPKKKRYDLLIEIFRNIDKSINSSSAKLVSKILDSLSNGERNDFFRVQSQFLMKSPVNIELWNFFKIFPQNNWIDINKVSRLRIENMIKISVAEGKEVTEYDEDGSICDLYFNCDGELAHYALSHIPYFSNKKEIYDLMQDCICIGDNRLAYFKKKLINIFDIDPDCILDMDIIIDMIKDDIAKNQGDKWLVAIIQKKLFREKNATWLNLFQSTVDKRSADENATKLEELEESNMPF